MGGFLVSAATERSAYETHWRWRRGMTEEDPVAKSGRALPNDAARIERIFDCIGDYLGPDAAPAIPPWRASHGVMEGGFLGPGALPASVEDARDFAILGMIDDAPPLFHPGLEVDGTSRLAAVWLMGLPADLDLGYPMPLGRELRGHHLDAVQRDLAGSSPEDLLRACGLWDPRRGARHCGGRAGGHGVAVGHLLAGMSAQDPARRRRPLIAVGLPPSVVRDVEGTFAPWFLYSGALFVLRRAAALVRDLRASKSLPAQTRPPVVVNVSFGIAAGSKDGHDLVAEAFAQLSRKVVGRADVETDLNAYLGDIRFVLAIGNTRRDRLHAILEPGTAVTWRMPPGDASPNLLEIWGSTEQEPQVEITAPDGSVCTLGPLGASPVDAATTTGRSLLRAYRLRAPDVMGRRGILVAVPPTEPAGVEAPGLAGRWRVASPPKGETFVLHVQRDDSIPGFGRAGRQSHLVGTGADGHGDPVRETGTLNAFAVAPGLVRVGALRGPGPAPYSSLTGDGGAGEGQAVADASHVLSGIAVPGALAGTRLRLSGTSVAAPQVARHLADLLASGQPVGPGDLILGPTRGRPAY